MSDKELDGVALPDGDESIEEGKGHDMKNAESDSVASVAKAEDGTKKAPARKGDKANAQSSDLPKSKAAMINAGYKAMSSMKKEDLEALLAHMDGVELAEGEEVEGIELPENSYDFSEDLNALVESEQTLSDEFKAKTAVIFETAINSKVGEVVERLEDDYQTRLSEEMDATRTDLVEKVDSYLNYVVENWMEQNALAVESGLRTEIAEGFMNKLKDVFEESYIEVPESKVDLVDELATSVEELEGKINEQTGNILAMTEQLESFQRDAVIRENADGLAATEVEKLRSLVEGLDFEDEATFSDKVKTVRESYFKKEVTESVTETADDWSEEEATVGSDMSSYLNAIKKISKE